MLKIRNNQILGIYFYISNPLRKFVILKFLRPNSPHTHQKKKKETILPYCIYPNDFSLMDLMTLQVQLNVYIMEWVLIKKFQN